MHRELALLAMLSLPRVCAAAHAFSLGTATSRAAVVISSGAVFVESQFVCWHTDDRHHSAPSLAIQTSSPRVSCWQLHGAELEEARIAAESLRPLTSAAVLGRRTAVETSKRDCACLDLLNDAVWPTLPSPLLRVVARIDQLRDALAAQTGRPLLGDAELQLLHYREGGHYARHVDDGTFTANSRVRRSISLLLYLTPSDWRSEDDGGALRVHYDGDGGRASYYEDIEPSAGTLVLFDSSSVPHEVLTTRRERIAIVGWLLEAR